MKLEKTMALFLAVVTIFGASNLTSFAANDPPPGSEPAVVETEPITDPAPDPEPKFTPEPNPEQTPDPEPTPTPEPGASAAKAEAEEQIDALDGLEPTDRAAVLDKQADIVKAQEAYEGLSREDKEAFPQAKKERLDALRAALDGFLQEDRPETAGEGVTAMCAELDGVDTADRDAVLAHGEAITALYKAYAKLADMEKSAIPEETVQRIEALNKALETFWEAGPGTAEEAAALMTDALLALDPADEQAVLAAADALGAAKAAYDALPAAEKTAYDPAKEEKLLALWAAYEAYAKIRTADAVLRLIEALPAPADVEADRALETPALDYRALAARVAEAREAYESLSEADKAGVDAAALEKLAALERLLAGYLEDLLAQILAVEETGVYELVSDEADVDLLRGREEAIRAARAALDGLGAEQAAAFDALEAGDQTTDFTGTERARTGADLRAWVGELCAVLEALDSEWTAEAVQAAIDALPAPGEVTEESYHAVRRQWLTAWTGFYSLGMPGDIAMDKWTALRELMTGMATLEVTPTTVIGAQGGGTLHANGLSLLLAAGSSNPDYTVVYIDKDGSGTVTSGDSIFTPGGAAGNSTATGNDLSNWFIYGGSKGGTVSGAKLTMTGGKVSNIYGGGQGTGMNIDSSVTGSTSVTITGGTVIRDVAGGGFGCAVSGTASVTVAGGTVAGNVIGGDFMGGSVGGVSVTIGGGAAIGADDNAYSGLLISNIISSFAISPSLTDSACVRVNLPSNFDASVNPTIATGAVEADLAKVKLAGDGANGKETYFENNAIKVRAAAARADYGWYGDGTAATFQIGTEAQLLGFANLVNGADGKTAATFEGKTVKLTANITFSGGFDSDSDAANGNWTPIGSKIDDSNQKPFMGTFDGGGKTVDNMTVNAPDTGRQGFFGYVQNGAVNNLTIGANSAVTGKQYVGGVAGYGEDSTFSGCVNRAAVTTPVRDVQNVVGHTGGIVGALSPEVGVCSPISDCKNYGKIAGDVRVGGIVGGCKYPSGEYIGHSYPALSELANYGEVSGTKNVGGLAGYVTWMGLLNSFNKGAVTCGDSGGGLAGLATGGGVMNCWNSGAVTGTGQSAMVYGLTNDSSGGPIIKNCYNIGNVSVPEGAAYAYAFSLSNGLASQSNNVFWLDSLTGNHPQESTDNRMTYGSFDTSGKITYLSKDTADGFNRVYRETLAEQLNERWSRLPDLGLSYHYWKVVPGENSGYPVFTDERPSIGNWAEEGNRDRTWTGGTIADAADLAQFAWMVNDGTDFAGETVTLGGNIDLDGHDWTPIGTQERPFNGTFDGSQYYKYTVSNMTVYAPDANDQGFFGYVGPKGWVKNLEIGEGSSVTGNGYVGGVAGRCAGDIYKCSNQAAVTANGSDLRLGGRAGGIAGSISGNAIVDGCNNYGTVTSKGKNAGGLIGELKDAKTELKNSSNGGAVSGAAYVGGLVGESSGSVYYCNNYGTVTGSADQVGGVVGALIGTVDSCANTGAVSAPHLAGGLTGKMYSNSHLKNSSNTGDITTTGVMVGGLAGWCNVGAVENCWNSGSVTGSDELNQVAGLVGYLHSGATLSNGYNIGTVKNNYSGRAAYGLAKSESTTVSNCYWLAGTATSGVSGQHGALTAIGSFGEAMALAASDNTTLDYGETLPLALNRWVMQNGGAKAGYKWWTMAQYPALVDLPPDGLGAPGGPLNANLGNVGDVFGGDATKNGNTITLSKDVTVIDPVGAGGGINATLDLGTHTLDGKPPLTVNGGSVTAQNGTLAGGDRNPGATVSGGGTLTVGENLTVKDYIAGGTGGGKVVLPGGVAVTLGDGQSLVVNHYGIPPEQTGVNYLPGYNGADDGPYKITLPGSGGTSVEVSVPTGVTIDSTGIHIHAPGADVTVGGKTYHLSDGSTIKPDGTIALPNRVTLPSGAAVTLPEGSHFDQDGRIVTGSGDSTVTLPESAGTVKIPGGSTIDTSAGTNEITLPGGAVTFPENVQVTVPAGSRLDSDTGKVTLPSSGSQQVILPGSGSGTVAVTVPGGSTVDKDGAIALPGSGGSVTIGGNTITLPGGSTIGKDGTINFPTEGGTIDLPGGGKVTIPGKSALDGSTGVITMPVDATGSITLPGKDGAIGGGDDIAITILGSGAVQIDGGKVAISGPGSGYDNFAKLPGGNIVTLPDGTVIDGGGGKNTITIPESGTVTVTNAGGPGQDATIAIPSGSAIDKEGNITTGGDSTLTLPDSGGDVKIPGGSVIDPVVNITLPAHGSQTITLPGSGGGVEVTVPGGSAIHAGSGKVTLPGENTSGQTVTFPGSPDVTVKVPGGSTVGTGGVVTLPAGGGEVILPGGDKQIGTNDDIPVSLPEGSTITPDGAVKLPDGDSDTTLSDGTKVTIPGGSTMGGDGAITTPDDSTGTVTLPNGSGSMDLPGGSTIAGNGTVTTGKDTELTLPGESGTGDTIVKVPGGSTLLPDKGTITLPGGDKDNTITLPGAGGGDAVTVKPDGNAEIATGDGTITLPGGGTATIPNADGTGGSAAVTLPGGSTVDPDSGKANILDGTPGAITLPGGGGRITVPGGSSVGGDGAVTVNPAGGEVTLPGSGGAVTVPGGSSVNPGAGEITLPGGGGQVTFPEGGKVTLPQDSTVNPDGTASLPTGGGTITVPGGKPGGTTVAVPDGTTVKPDGTVLLPDGGQVTLPNNSDGAIPSFTPPSGSTIGQDGVIRNDHNGTEIQPDGSVTVPVPGAGGTGVITVPTGPSDNKVPAITDSNGNADDGTVTVPDGGRIVMPDGTEITPPNGSSVAPGGGISASGVYVRYNSDGSISVSTESAFPANKTTTVKAEPGTQLSVATGGKIKVSRGAAEVTLPGGGKATIPAGSEASATEVALPKSDSPQKPAQVILTKNGEENAPTVILPEQEGAKMDADGNVILPAMDTGVILKVKPDGQIEVKSGAGSGTGNLTVDRDIATSDDAVRDAALTPGEKAIMQNGIDVTVELKSSAPTDPDLGETHDDWMVGDAREIELIKKIGNAEVKLSNALNPIELQFTVPAGLAVDGRTFSVLRDHNGARVVLPDRDNAPDTVTVQSDKFSLYALLYKGGGSAPPPSGGGATPPPSGGGSGGFSGGSGGSGGASLYRDGEYDFWMQVKKKIKDAKPGDTVKANARRFDRMPESVMQALREQSGVTLQISWSGGKIAIPAGGALTRDSLRIYYPLSWLAGTYEKLWAETDEKFSAEAAEAESGPEKINPKTGGVWEVSAPKPPLLSIAPPATAADTGLAATPKQARELGEQAEKAAPTSDSPDAPAAAPAKNGMVWPAALLLLAIAGGSAYILKRRKKHQA